MTFRTTIALTSAVGCALLTAACGTESAAGDVAAFCDELRRLDSDEPVDMQEDFEAGMAELERVRQLAPSEIRGDIDVVVDKFGEFEELESSSGDDADEFGAALALAFDPGFIAAAENVEAFGVEECGLEPSSVEGDEGSFGELDDLEREQSSESEASSDDDAVQATADGATPAEGQLVTEPTDVPDPLYDPFFNDEPLDTTELSIGGAQYFLDVNYTDAPWRTKLASWSIFGSGSPEVGVGGLDITGSEAPQVCSALLDYLQSLDVAADGTLVVSTYGRDADGGFGDEEELLRTSIADGC